MVVTELSRNPIDIYLASGNHDSVGSLKAHLEKIKMDLLFDKFDQGKTSQFVKVQIIQTHVHDIIWYI